MDKPLVQVGGREHVVRRQVADADDDWDVMRCGLEIISNYKEDTNVFPNPLLCEGCKEALGPSAAA